MHWMPDQPRSKETPETTGKTIHWAGEYDLFSRFMGMGVNARNSRMVVELAGIKPGESVLDVACGTGSLTLTAAHYAGPRGQVYGIDASPEMIEVAKKKAARAGAPVTFRVELAEKLLFPDATFDVIISRLAIHHLPDDLKPRAFAEMLRVLKPGGRVLLADFVQPSNHLMNHLAAVMMPAMMNTETWKLPPMLSEAGFVNVSSGPTRSSFLAYVSGRKQTN